MAGLDTPLTPLRFLRRTADVHPGKVGIIDGPRRITWSEAADEAERVARALRADGVGDGDRVMYLASNSAENVIAHFAVPLAGAVLVATNTRLSADEVAYIVDHSESKVVFVESSLLPTYGEVLAEAGVRVVVLPEQDGSQVAVDGTVSYPDFLGRAGDERLTWTVQDETATLTLNYTSGTTGRPKGVMYTHRGGYLNALGECLHQGFDLRTRYLWTLPLFHCNGWCSAWAVTAVGGTHVCLRAVRGPDLWRLLLEEKVDHLAGAPTVLSIMADAAEAKPLTEPLVVVTAGAPPHPTVIERLHALNATVVHVYGLTETYGPYSVCEWQETWDDLGAKELSVQLARQGVGMITAEELRVVRAGDSGPLVDVPSDGVTMGEIVMRGNTVMKGYFKDDEATADAFAGGWFHSGDLGVRHPDGYVQLLDRAKDVVISGGENISSVEVEQALVSHPAVSDAAVIGVPDERWGEVPKAFVVLAEGGHATEEELIEHVRQRLARFKAPKTIEIFETLPKTATGKIRKHELKQQAGGLEAPGGQG